MSEERVKKIQPFTIGTKLSVPAGAKCQDFGDVLPAPVSDGCRLKSTSSCQGQAQPTILHPTPVEDCGQEERDSLCPPAISRSIKKIAICGSSETEEGGAGVDPNQGLDPPERRREDGSTHLPPSEPWRKRKIKNLPYDYGILGFPLEHSEGASPSQQRDLKDLENSLIHLTASLDLEKHELEENASKSSSGFGLEILGRRNSIGETFDKLWLKFRSLLHGYQQDLMLALDVSSFYQQADIIINTISAKRDTPHVGNVQCSPHSGRGEISRQIKMLSESAARLSNLHPTLASQVTLKQAEVLESWAVLQDALRNERVASPKGHCDPQTSSTESQCLSEFELHGGMGKNVKEEQNRLLESGILRPVDDFSPRSRPYCKLDCTPGKQFLDSKSKDQLAVSETFTHQKPLDVLEGSTLSADAVTWSWLKDNMSVQSGEDRGNLKQSKEHTGTKMEELLDQDVPALQKDFSVSECNEKFLDMPDDLNVSRYHVNHGRMNEELLNMLSTVTLHINQHLSRSAELSMDILDMEIDMTMQHDLDFAGLEGLQEQQDDLEVDYGLIGGEVEDMEIQVRQLPVPTTDQGDLTEEVQSVLQAWEEVGRNMIENRERLATFRQLQDYFKTYLETVAWAETIKSCILSGGAAPQSEAAHIDYGIEQKLLELETLAVSGQRLVEEGNDLAEIIKEHTEELRSMLEWIQVNWKTQKQELCQNNSKSENRDSGNYPCIKEREEMQTDEASQHFHSQPMSRDESLPDQQDVRSDDPGFVFQEPWSTQASLGSNICLILSLDEPPPLISQVCKEPSPNSSELHMLPLPGNNKIQQQQSSVKDHVTTQPSLEVNQAEGLHCSIAVTKQSLGKNKHFGSNRQVQQTQLDILTQRQQSGYSPVDRQPSLDVFQRDRPDSINPELKQQRLQNQRLQSPTSHGEELEQPKLVHLQSSQSPTYRHIEAPSPANSTSERTEQEGVKTSANNSIHQWQQSLNTTEVHQQSPENTQACGDSEDHPAERQQLIVHAQTSFPSQQRTDQSQNTLFVISEEERHNVSGICGQCSTQLSAGSSDSCQVKDQQSGDKQQDLEQLSVGGSMEQGALEKTGDSEVTHRVSTYLHVTDSLRALSSQKADDGTMSSTAPPLFSCPSPPRQARSGSVAAHSHGTASGSVPAPLEQRIQRKESSQRRLSALGVVRHIDLSQSTTSPCTFRERSNTWPIGDEHRKTHQTNTNRHDSDKRKGVTVFRDNPVPEEPREPVKNISSYLSLGSTLSFSLPRDFRALYSRAADPRSSEERQSTNQPLLQTVPTGSSSDHAPGLQPAHNLLGKSNPQPFLTVDKGMLDPNHESEESEHNKIQQRAYSQKIPAEFCPCEEDTQQDMEKHTEAKGPFPVDYTSTTTSCSPPPRAAPRCTHTCPSVHTRIEDLNGHVFHGSRYVSNQLTDSRLGPGRSNRVVVCGERDCTVCCSFPAENSSSEDCVEAPQPSHWQFQEEEEELEDIWRERVGEMASDWTVESGRGQKAGLVVQIAEGPVALSLHG